MVEQGVHIDAPLKGRQIAGVDGCLDFLQDSLRGLAGQGGDRYEQEQRKEEKKAEAAGNH
ncbi:MAG: hypothetical protein ACLUPV_07125 [Bilophila wadsworthia]